MAARLAKGIEMADDQAINCGKCGHCKRLRDSKNFRCRHINAGLTFSPAFNEVGLGRDRELWPHDFAPMWVRSCREYAPELPVKPVKTQAELFDADPEDVGPTDPNIPGFEVSRLSKQCRAILNRLREGAVTNYDLANIALGYTARISDLRAAGFTIEHEPTEDAGVYRYRLTGVPGHPVSVG